VHVCVDDATRLVYVEVLADERAETSVAFLERAVAWLAERGVEVRQVMTDNGPPYRSGRWVVRGPRRRAHPDAPLPAAHERQGVSAS
jgi:hypothetical protein